jgi:transcriptional regulator with XRE-family HTH domain
MTFGKWLKAKLKSNHVSQKTLAHQICVSENTVTSWTRDDRTPSIRNFLWICRYIALEENTSMQIIIQEAAEYF